MISRPILYRSDWQKFRFWNGVTGCIQSSLSMQMRYDSYGRGMTVMEVVRQVWKGYDRY